MRVLPRQRALTDEEATALLSHTPSGRPRGLVRTLQVLGARVSEGLALRWPDVRAGEVVLPHLKARRLGAVRLLPVDLVPLLGEAGMLPAPDGLLFPIHRVTAWRWLSAAAESAGLGRVTPHTLRHTFATRWLRRGGSLPLLQRWLGHARIDTTIRLYGHLDVSDMAREFERLDMGHPLPLQVGQAQA